MDNFIYLELLSYLCERFNTTYDFKDKKSFEQFYSYFEKDFKKEYFELTKYEIFDNRLNEAQLIAWTINFINNNQLKNLKTKEELIEISMKEKIDNVFLISCLLLFRNLTSHHISIKLMDEFGNYITDEYGDHKYSNCLDLNLKKLISLYCTDYQDDNIKNPSIIRDKIFTISELLKLNFIRDIPTLKNTFYQLFVDLKQV